MLGGKVVLTPEDVGGKEASEDAGGEAPEEVVGQNRDAANATEPPPNTKSSISNSSDDFF